MTRIDWLFLKDEEDEKTGSENILNAWYAMGQITVNNDTKIYSKGSLIRVDASDGSQRSRAPLHNRILFCQEDYVVNGRDKQPINWAIMKPDDLDGLLVAVEGVATPFWVILQAKWNGTFQPDKNFVPFQDDDGETVEALVNISDEELTLCLADLGVPFVNWHDLEYNRNEIINLCVKPALDRYFTFMPIIKEEGNLGQYSRGGQFKIELPEDAYNAVPYFCSGVGGGIGNPGSPFSFFAEQTLWGGGGGLYGTGSSRFGRGVRYFNKQQPGFTGIQGHLATIRDNLAIAQNQVNFLRQEKYHLIKENGKRYITGFSTVSGQLNILFLCASKNWDDVKFEHLTDIARPLVKIEALRAINYLRKLVKGDVPGAIETDAFLQRADKLEEQVNKLIGSITTTYQLAISRSGGGQ